MVVDDESLLLYATLTTDHVFETFSIESKSGNVIGLEIGLSNLTHALKMGASVEWVQLKLTKRGAMPYLSIESRTVDGGLEIVQDVPVRVLAASEFEKYDEPNIDPPKVGAALLRLFQSSRPSLLARCMSFCVLLWPAQYGCGCRDSCSCFSPFRWTVSAAVGSYSISCTPLLSLSLIVDHPTQVRLVIPAVKTLHSVLDRMRSLGGKSVCLSADMRLRELSVSSSTDAVAIKSFFRGLSTGDEDDENVDPEGE